ncbi:MAG TPA: hypothetical protein VN374_04240, partial [Desulfitobacteriaceae bacterium]|nr:hypothetical protein [Desulfitobacteriaceae bacterium]
AYANAKLELELELEKVVPADPGPIYSSISVDGIGNGKDKNVSVEVRREGSNEGSYIYVKATATIGDLKGKEIVNRVSSSATVRLNQNGDTQLSYTSSETTTIPATYIRVGTVGKDGTQWLKE